MLRLARSVASQRALSKALAQRRGVATVSSSAGSKEQDGRSLEAMTSAAVALTGEFPAWLRTEMRTNHAGEFGAVEIYTGALYAAAARSRMNLETDGGRMRLFAEHHMATEQAHLDIMLKLVPASNRTRLLPIWRAAALSLGFFPALAGPRCLYWTVRRPAILVLHHLGGTFNSFLPCLSPVHSSLSPSPPLPCTVPPTLLASAIPRRFRGLVARDVPPEVQPSRASSSLPNHQPLE